MHVFLHWQQRFDMLNDCKFCNDEFNLKIGAIVLRHKFYKKYHMICDVIITLTDQFQVALQNVNSEIILLEIKSSF